MKQTILNIVDQKILPYIFKVSEQPMLYRELLKANKLYDDKMRLEGNVPGMRIRIGRAILIYAVLWHIFFIIPASAIFHIPLAKLDCHLSIILAVVVTGFFFATYFMFKEWVIDRMTLKRIKEAWSNHFTHFDYNLHHQEVSELYADALDHDVPSKEMQLYILNKLVGEK